MTHIFEDLPLNHSFWVIKRIWNILFLYKVRNWHAVLLYLDWCFMVGTGQNDLLLCYKLKKFLLTKPSNNTIADKRKWQKPIITCLQLMHSVMGICKVTIDHKSIESWCSFSVVGCHTLNGCDYEALIATQ